MASIWKKLASILLEEEEITTEEDLNEVHEMIEIPKLKPMSEISKPKPINETSVPKIVVEESILEIERKSVMIDVDVREEVKVVETFVKKIAPAKYQKTEIISPIFGGPTVPTEPIENKVYVQAKTRQPLTEIISPMFGKVTIEDQKTGIDASLLDINLSDMLRSSDNGDEVQASLFDYLEGLNENEE